MLARTPAATLAERRFTRGCLTIEFDTRQAWVAGEPVTLSGTEYRLLEHLLLCQGTVVTDRFLLASVFGHLPDPHIDNLRFRVYTMRKKLGQVPGSNVLIDRIACTGYVLHEPSA